MMICPRCRSEFISTMTHCKACATDLIPSSEIAPEDQAHQDARRILSEKKTVRLATGGSLENARAVEKAALACDIPCFVSATESDDVTLSAAMRSYEIIVAEEDAERVFEMFKSNYEAMIAKEGLGEMVTTVVNLEDAEVTCPACGHHGALVAGACGDCELSLGAPE